MDFIEIVPVSKILSHTRYLLTLRSAEGVYRSLLLFRLSTNSATENAESESIADQLYVMESACPHLGADLSHADIEECETGAVAVCPWHRYDFDMRTGQSDTGLRACVYKVEIKKASSNDIDDTVWIEAPEGGTNWRLVEFRPVSEDFADPPPQRAVTNSIESSTPDLITLREPVVPIENPPKTLIEWAVLILNTAHPQLKVERTKHAVSLFRSGKLKSIGRGKDAPKPPDVPPREDVMKFVDPGRAAKRKGRPAMLHALANIEQWAIDLAWDAIARFGPAHPTLPHQFFSDFTKVALDEAKHFSLLLARLHSLSTFYGSLPIHAALWSSATETAHSLRARLAIVHLVHEARGLDVNPSTISKFAKQGDEESVKALNIIHNDELTHVTAGHRWFTFVCKEEGVDPVSTFREEVKRHFSGSLKGPFNVEDREKAGLTREFYEDLVGELREQPKLEVPSVKVT
ncbi:DUF455-domain-containing protein [Fomitiporia mediterranea MF3/22]|uniref:DUF455-domain-containing protein n=1 Tax=Fomitiporia mediterranea (strain MF3/22) TaxID=694068 RepID=UPI000440781C|nr:DUF455-domain-containing protein [Fomitiporia mediterranea MF3/22]EJC99452.1 DUF455-domain-containing protein [Fomitiporia mediterranea MF3/22]